MCVCAITAADVRPGLLHSAFGFWCKHGTQTCCKQNPSSQSNNVVSSCDIYVPDIEICYYPLSLHLVKENVLWVLRSANMGCNTHNSLFLLRLWLRQLLFFTIPSSTWMGHLWQTDNARSTKKIYTATLHQKLPMARWKDVRKKGTVNAGKQCRIWMAGAQQMGGGAPIFLC
jgi:hypothetical protein